MRYHSHPTKGTEKISEMGNSKRLSTSLVEAGRTFKKHLRCSKPMPDTLLISKIGAILWPLAENVRASSMAIPLSCTKTGAFLQPASLNLRTQKKNVMQDMKPTWRSQNLGQLFQSLSLNQRRRHIGLCDDAYHWNS